MVFNLQASTAIKARINDKLSRLRNDNKDEDEDIILDLLGYFILLRIALKKEQSELPE
jgi:hemerythrin-like domain-containing protein